MTQAQAIAAALAEANAPSSAPLVVSEMTLRAYEKLTSEQPDPAISPNRLVWVVTVHAPMWTDGAPLHPPYLKQNYTVVIDATSKQGIEICIGCATLTS
jgi:hypothetical protein